MSHHRIINRAGEILAEGEATSLKDLVERLVADGVSLANADFCGADLSGRFADDLAGADLQAADFRGADFRGADLTDAYLRGADIRGACVSCAHLRGAYLGYARLDGVRITDSADSAFVDCASDDIDPHAANLLPARQAADYRVRHRWVPVVDRLDARILEAIESGGGLDMERWHTCETMHCRAGWAIRLAGSAGHSLERRFGAAKAARAIYRASTGRSPDFYAAPDRALKHLRLCAQVDGRAL